MRLLERMSLVTSARFCIVERAWSRGKEGRPAARGTKQNARWSRRMAAFAPERSSTIAHWISRFRPELTMWKRRGTRERVPQGPRSSLWEQHVCTVGAKERGYRLTTLEETMMKRARAAHLYGACGPSVTVKGFVPFRRCRNHMAATRYRKHRLCC